MAKTLSERIITIVVWALFIAGIIADVILLGGFAIRGLIDNWQMVLSILVVAGIIQLIDFLLFRAEGGGATGFEKNGNE